MSVLYEKTDHIAHVTIDRADRLNAIDPATERELEDIWAAIEADPDVRVAVLTGAGERAFCAGADLKVQDDQSGLDYWLQERPGGFGGIAMRRSLEIPVIARVNGLAVGGGFEMVLGCDIVVAAEEASFSLPEPRVGRLPLTGGMVLLPRLIPEKKAKGLLLTGRKLSATEAERIGLVTEVVAKDLLDDAVQRWVDDILACAPLCVRALKQSLDRTAHLSPHEAQALRLPAVTAALTSSDAEEGVRAYREKRAPVWKGE